MLRTTYSYGASVRGPLHKSEGLPNEDAWLRAAGAFGSLIVVCDGMGSKPQSRLGAKAASIAVREAVVRWSKVDGAPLQYLAHLIEVVWRLRIHPVEPSNASTTCLLALACASGDWIVGGVGDGLVLTRTGGDLASVIGERGPGFGNETIGLGASTGPRAWRLERLPATTAERVAVLATDGVADDLIPEKLGPFSDWLVDTFQVLSPAQRWRQLSAELRAWPTPRHLDDKTLAVLRTPAAASEKPE